MGREMFEILKAIIIYSIIGLFSGMSIILKKHSIWQGFTLLIVCILTLAIVSKHYKNSNLKLFGKIDITVIGPIITLCLHLWVIFMFSS